MTDLSPDAKELLRQARTALSPPQGRLDAVRTAMQVRLAGSASAATSASSPVSSVGVRAIGTGAWGTSHTLVAAVVAGALGAGGVAAWTLRERADRPTHADIAPVEARQGGEPPGAIEENPAASEPPPVAIPTPTWQASPGDLTSSTKAAAPSRDRVHGGAQRVRAKTETTRDPPSEPPVAPAGDSLAEEVNMLRSARAALDRGDATQALRLLDAHEARFVRGTLYEERLATRVLALCTLGRIDAARATALELEGAAPRSPHLARVRASCIAQPSNK